MTLAEENCVLLTTFRRPGEPAPPATGVGSGSSGQRTWSAAFAYAAAGLPVAYGPTRVVA